MPLRNTQAKILGPLDLLNDETALYYVKILPGGEFFENYSLNNIPAAKFNSPLASLKSAFFIHSENLNLNENLKTIVIVENV